MTETLLVVFIGLPLAAAGIVINVVCYAAPLVLIYAYCTAHRGN